MAAEPSGGSEVFEAMDTFLPMVDGVLVAVPDSLDLAVPYVLREQGDWFEEELPFVRRLLGEGAKVVDIGANYGVYTLSMARRVGDRGAVWAFEPAPTTMRYLERSLTRNGMPQVRALEIALSNRSGSTVFHVSPHAELNSMTPGAGTEAIEVALQTLDAAALELGWSDIAFMKIDAEGEESRILEGGRAFFARESPLVMFEIRHGAERNDTVIGEFASMGYGLFRYVPGLGALAPLEGQPDAMLLNVFAAKPDTASALEQRGLLVGPAVVVPREGAWETLRTTAYGSLFRRIQTAASRPRAEAYLRALDHYLTPGSPSERFAHLEASHGLLKEALEASASLPRLQTFARVARELGRRVEAVQALTLILQSVQDPRFLVIDEPFVPVAPRYESLDPGPDASRWCTAAALEEREMLRMFSTFYEANPPLQTFQVMARLGFMSEAMKRRLTVMAERVRFSQFVSRSGAATP